RRQVRLGHPGRKPGGRLAVKAGIGPGRREVVREPTGARLFPRVLAAAEPAGGGAALGRVVPAQVAVLAPEAIAVPVPVRGAVAVPVTVPVAHGQADRTGPGRGEGTALS